MRADAERVGVRGWRGRGRQVLQAHFDFSRPRGRFNAAAAVAALCALVSLLRGQDANWDLRNYHLHNAWALLEGRVGVDLAPAQMQSYFPPLLDVPYFLLVQDAPAPVAGAFMGLLHGLAFLPVAWVAFRTLEGDARRPWLAPLLGFAGLASAAFLSELGNTMGDNSTAPLVLGALALMLPAPDGSWRVRHTVLAGLLLGMAVAFKLTNAIYAVALGLAVLAAPRSWGSRVRSGLCLALVALGVFAVLAGPWLYRLWEAFGNPLFPQFNAWFQSPLASPVSVGDTRWLPASLGEALVRPLLFTVNPYLVSEIALLQVGWALLYVAALGAAPGVVNDWRLRRRAVVQSAPPAMVVRRMLAVFFVVAFAAWLLMFSIHRYLVPLELLSPLALWLLVHRAVPGRLAGRIAAGAVALAAMVALAGWNGWGHAGWSRTAFRVDPPPGAMPGVVLLVGTEPQAWRLPFLPGGAVYASVGSNFPESAGYAARVDALVRLHGGTAGVILPMAANRRAESIQRRNHWAARLGLDTGDCAVLRWLAAKSRSLQLVEPGQSSTGRCQLAQAGSRAVDVAGANQAIVDDAVAVLARYGLQMDPSGCIVLDSRIGAQAHPYRWCRAITRSP